MYFKESELNENLLCEKCKVRLDEPRILPCGSVICNYCCKSLKIANHKFKCIICDRTHVMDNISLPINKQIANFLSKQPVYVSRGKSYENLNKTLKEIDEAHKHIVFAIKDSHDYVKEYYLNLENELQLSKDQLLLECEEYHLKLSDEVKRQREDRLSKLDAKLKNLNLEKDFKQILDELKSFYEKWTEYLKSNNIVKDDYLDEINTNGQSLIEKASLKRKNMDTELLDQKCLVFSKKEKLEMKCILGKFENQIISTILTNSRFIELMKLCKFNLNLELNLIYRASRDGFGAKDFHSKCDKKTNTLVVIKSQNGNIFGGYTQNDWSGNCIYKSDLKAFIFSLVTESTNKSPRLIEVSNSDSAIYCNPNYGPTFGRGHDLHICNNSNLDKISFSNLDHSYSMRYCQKDTFLADSYYFLVADIEVYSSEQSPSEEESRSDESDIE